MILSHEFAQSIHARKKSALVFESATEKSDHKHAVHQRETAVMHAEERDDEQFGRPSGDVARCREQHLQYVGNADHDVFQPEQEEQWEHLPTEYEHADQRHQIRRHQRNY